MEKKEKLIIVILFSLSLSAILTNVLGQTTYTCELKDGDEYIYRLTEMDAFWAITQGAQLGDKMKFKIAGIGDSLEFFELEIDYWNIISKSESFGANPDYSDFDKIYKDPSHNLTYIFYFALAPVSDYLAAFALANSDYSSSGNVLTEDFHGYITTTTFDSNGIMTKIQYSNSTTVYYTMSRSVSSSSIPGYDLPLLIGLTAIASISIIYIVVKKKMLK